MPITRIVQVECDFCAWKTADYEGVTAYGATLQAEKEGWHIDNQANKVYCPECWKRTLDEVHLAFQPGPASLPLRRSAEISEMNGLPPPLAVIVHARYLPMNGIASPAPMVAMMNEPDMADAKKAWLKAHLDERYWPHVDIAGSGCFDPGLLLTKCCRDNFFFDGSVRPICCKCRVGTKLVLTEYKS